MVQLDKNIIRYNELKMKNLFITLILIEASEQQSITIRVGLTDVHVKVVVVVYVYKLSINSGTT